MAVIRENITLNNKEYVKNYSDVGYLIERDGVQYAEAIDPIEYAEERVYTETDIPVDGTDEATIEDYQDALARLEVDLNEETSVTE